MSQGSYLTEAPMELVILLNTIYQEKNGQSLPHIDIANQSHKEASLSEMTYSEKNALDDIFMDEKELNLILATLSRKKNIIIQGPPGVGKTFISKRLAYLMIRKKDPTRIGFTQFHQSYSYEDFMQGWRPTEGGGFKLQNGPFYEMCKQAEKFPDHDYIFIIDEINRGNLSKIFGELMMLIESDKRGKVNEIRLIYSQGPEDKFFVPLNLYLIGLMNTADRSLAMVDYALRRRFGFLNLTPQFESKKFENTITKAGGSKALVSDIRSKLGELNQFIRQDKDLGQGFQIGHSYFCPQRKITDENEWYQSILNSEIKPLLDEYWFLDPAMVDERMGMLQR
jgi:5-methylcytosine-specific restriction protein B